MARSNTTFCLTIGLVVGLVVVCGFAGQALAQQKQKTVIPFDFESKWDKGRYGEMVSDMVWKKLEREGGFLIPDAMADVRDLCATNNIKLAPETPLDKVKEVLRGTFDADIAIWGSVERAPGTDGEIYDLVIKCVDFTSAAEPKVIYEKTARTNSVSEIPHLYIKEMLDKLYDRQAQGPAPVDQLAEEAWEKNPNLVKGGGFERGTNGVPTGWESRCGQNREPLGKLVAWLPEAGNSQNHVVRFTLDRGIAESFGVMYYSDFFPVSEGAKYRFQCRYRTNGPSPKVFIKCYDEMGSEYKDETAQSATRPTASSSKGNGKKYQPKRNDYVPEEGQRREVYRSQQNLKGGKNTWNVQTEDFTPKHTKYSPKWGRVMLYAYLSAGVVEFDDVVIKEIIPASPSEQKKVRRHSTDTKVTIEEMEENEARGKEARQRIREGKDE
jgi:hypothetical protein